MAKFVRNYETVGIKDIALVGGKNASLGEMIQNLATAGVRIPDGFVITADAYSELIGASSIQQDLDDLLNNVDARDTDELSRRGQQARSLVKQSGIPLAVKKEICEAYRALEELYGKDVDVAVRSSATA